MPSEITVPTVPKFNPAAPYSTALRAGDLLFISGQVATDENNEIVGEGDVREQVRQIFRNLGAILEAAGGSYADLAKLTYYYQHVDDVAKLSGVREEFLSPPYPVATGVEIVRLADTRLLVEVDAIAALSPQVTNPSEVERREVVIVGGGLAGLTAAWDLRDRDVLLLEAEPRAGGRLYSLRRDPYWLNLGAGVFSAENSPVRELIAAMGLETRAIPGSTTALMLGNRIVKGGRLETYPLRLPLSPAARVSLIRAGARVRLAVARYHALARVRDQETAEEVEHRVAAFEGDRSFGEFLGRLHPDVDAIFRASAANRVGAELETISANGGLGSFAYQWSGKQSMLNHNLVGGSGRLPEELARRLGSSIRSGATVTGVASGDDGVTVTYRSAGAERQVVAAAVIVATPADIARSLLQPLPAAVDTALAEIRYGPAVLAAAITTEQGPMPYDDIYALVTPKRPSTVFINVASTLRDSATRAAGGSVLVYRGGEGARELLTASDAEVTRILFEGLHDIFPSTRGLLDEIVVQRWERIVPFAYPGRHRVQHVLERSLGRVFLAGDYLGSWANMEVAAATGSRAARGARAILEYRPPSTR